MKKLIIHIGTGKTGISSIRRSALASSSNLSKSNIFYLGKFFEHNPLSPTTPNNYLQKGAHYFRDHWDTSTEKIFHQSLSELIYNKPEGSVLYILNESLHHLYHPFASSLKAFQENTGVQIKIKAYARNHEAYSVSAYKQWGLKHKTNTGPILSYTEWCQRFEKLFIRYGQQLKAWKEIFEKNMTIYNYDQVENAISHFQNVLREESNNPMVTLDNPEVRTNKTPGMDRLILHALANHAIQQQALPEQLDKLLNRHPLPSPNLANLDLSSLIPTPQDIQKLATSAAVQEDQEIVNDLLNSSNEKSLCITPEPYAGDKTSQDQHILLTKTISNLLHILISQDRSISRLEENIQQLQEKINSIDSQQKSDAPLSDEFNDNFFLYSRNFNSQSAE